MIAVTAASGRLGRATLRELAAQFPGRPRVAVVRQPAKFGAMPGAEVRPGDYEDVDSMTLALQGVEAMVLVSAPAIGGSDRIRLHRNAIEAARRAGVRRVLYTSVIGNGIEMQTGFAATQRANRQAEADLAASGLEWVVARNGFYLDIDVEQMRAANARGWYASSSGDGRCGYVSIAELAFATAQLVAGPRPAGRLYNLVGESISVPDLMRLTNEILGLDVEYRLLTDEQKLATARADLRVLARGGEEIAQMFTGLMQGQRLGAFDVPSDFEAAAGRPCKTMREMLRELAAAG
ncbi:MAG: NAD(P)H-binding protein [Steroidobacteraceae bacterium]|jgi:NAD(P)H dehydrogenase (quinone)|nr:NAD(P)H-binding protein [Steroidobacteraceae bacterium]